MTFLKYNITRSINKLYDRILIYIMIYMLFSIALPLHAVGQFADKSALAEGKWIKISVTKNGIHQISYSDLKKWGFSDPSKAKVYGYGGALLPERLDPTFIDDLNQLPIFRDEQRERILFYAQGPISWNYNKALSEFTHENNYFSTKGYYFITENGQPDQHPSDVANGGDTPSSDVTIFNDYALHETESVNLGKTGRELYGEDFRYTAIQEFLFSMPGIVADTTSKARVEFAARCEQKSKVTTQVNGITINKLNNGDIGAYAGTKSYEIAKQCSDLMVWENKGVEDIKFRISYTANGKVILARLNYIRLNAYRELQIYGSSVLFRNALAIDKLIRYKIKLNGSAAPNVRVWDITQPENPQNLQIKNDGDLLSFIPKEKGLKEYVAFDISKSFASPQWESSVSNQNLHALPQTDMVIIVPPVLLNEAERLAAFHREEDKLHVTVITPEVIYNEFSSGTPDATAYRRFLKMFYNREKKGDSQKLQYLLLFGDGTYDNRLLTPEWSGSKAAILLTYQTPASLSETGSYVIDDYFGFLEDSSGVAMSRDNLNVGIGRFPVRNIAEARAAVDKVISYTVNKEMGTWKNTVCFVADDGDMDWPVPHIAQADLTAKVVENEYPEYIVKKVYTDTYKQVVTASGESYPDAKKRIMDLLNEGVLMLNYSGHGSNQTWANEDLMNISDIQKLYLKRLPLFVTATCDYSRFDDITTSAGEELFLHPKGGAIALFTTTRVVYGTENKELNEKFTRHLLSRKENGERLRLGDIIREAKNDYKNSNNLKFVLLGDPAMKLAYPEYKMKVTEINGHPMSAEMDTLKAKGRVSIKGEVMLPSGEKDINFNGFVYPKVYDSVEKSTTLDNDGEGKTYTFDERKKLLYTGKDSVRAGEFSFEFRMPKEINYSYETGMINLYAHDNRGNEANGHFADFLVGDIDNSAVSETNGPTIKALYLNARSFVNGNTVNETPLFIAEIEDESGINVSGSMGHSITMTIDDNANMRYVLNNYFEAEAGAFGKGRIVYTMPEMAEGEHTLTFKVWDTENNSSTSTISFVVKKGLKPDIFNLFVDKNPARETTCFYLNHNRPNSIVSIRIGVYDFSGTEVWAHQEEGLSDMYRSFPVNWDLTDKGGRRLSPGIYIYRAYISTDGVQEATKSEKLIILAQ